MPEFLLDASMPYELVEKLFFAHLMKVIFIDVVFQGRARAAGRNASSSVYFITIIKQENMYIYIYMYREVKKVVESLFIYIFHFNLIPMKSRFLVWLLYFDLKDKKG